MCVCYLKRLTHPSWCQTHTSLVPSFLCHCNTKQMLVYKSLVCFLNRSKGSINYYLTSKILKFLLCLFRPDVRHKRIHVSQHHRRDVREDEGRRRPDDQSGREEAHSLLEPPHGALTGCVHWCWFTVPCPKHQHHHYYESTPSFFFFFNNFMHLISKSVSTWSANQLGSCATLL